MALVLADRVLETCTSPGTGTVSLLGAVVGYQTFLAAVGNGNTTYYTIADQSGANWEVGIGTVSTGPTLARTTILASSNAGALVNFSSGTQNIFVTYPAEVSIVASNNPSTSGYILKGNGAGVAPTWVVPSSIVGGAAGSNTQIQYNNSGAFGASSSFTYTSGTGALRAPEMEVSNGLFVNNLTVGTSYSIPSGYSATSAGPITIASGVTVTVPSGGKWVVL